MRTIGRRWPSNAPRGDYPALCDICGVKWRRSQLERMPCGLLACRLDYEDRVPYARPAHIPNDEGTGSTTLQLRPETDPQPVLR